MDLTGSIPFFRVDFPMVVLYSLVYGVVFILGLLGNFFVVVAVASHAQLRSTTDYLISSLAFADLLIIIFCLPTTLLNNILTEWHLGVFVCKMSTWINSTTSCASIYTLVAVTADRYLAICHTLKYTQWESTYTMRVIAAIWMTAGALAVPNLFSMDEVDYEYNNTTLTVCISKTDDKLHFILVNLLFAFVIPFLLIFVSYTKIFITVTTQRSLAVDAHIRDERIKLRVATMMLTVIVVFALCWVPLYVIYTYFFFLADQHSYTFYIASQMLRPFFQWLSLMSSSLNPLIYIAYSQKYRRAFHRILLMPCRSRYERVRGTLLRPSEPSTHISEAYAKKHSVCGSTRYGDLMPATRRPSGYCDAATISPSASPMLTILKSPKSEKRSTAAVCQSL